MPQLLDAKALALLWLTVRGEPVAAMYNIVWNNKTLFYQSGRKLDVPRHLRLGVVIICHAIRQAIEAGGGEFDFLAGEAPYKKQLALATRPLIQLRVAHRTLREGAHRMTAAAWQRLRGVRTACRAAWHNCSQNGRATAGNRNRLAPRFQVMPSATFPLLHKSLAFVLLPALLAGLVLLQCSLVVATTSITLDEVTHLELDLEIYRRGNFDAAIGLGTPPLHLLFTGWLPALSAQQVPLSQDEVPLLGNQARVLACLLIGVPFVLIVYCWLMVRRGPWLGFMGGALLACSPSVIAHGSLANTDACFALFALVALAVLNWYLQRPTRWRFLLLGIGLGLALAAKQSAVFLFFVATLMLAETTWREEAPAALVRRWLRVIAGVAPRMVLLVLIAFGVNWALYGFSVGPLLEPGKPHATFEKLFGTGPLATLVAYRVPVPASLLTFIFQMGHSRGGHPAFLFGMTSDLGWWYYFPVAFVFKSTPAELVGVLIALICLVRGRLWRDRVACSWWLSLVIFFSLTLFSHINIGQRHLLVMYPLLVLCLVDGLAQAFEGRWVAPSVLGLLLSVQVWRRRCVSLRTI